jgi:hypothetical protein
MGVPLSDAKLPLCYRRAADNPRSPCDARCKGRKRNGDRDDAGRPVRRRADRLCRHHRSYRCASTRDDYPFDLRVAAALSSSRAHSLTGRSPAARSHAARSSSATLIVKGRDALPPARGSFPLPPPGQPLPLASAGSTATRTRRWPAYTIRRCQPPRSAGHCTSAPCGSSPIQVLGSNGDRQSFTTQACVFRGHPSSRNVVRSLVIHRRTDLCCIMVRR